MQITFSGTGEGSSINSHGFFYLHKKQIQADPPTHPFICITAIKYNTYTFDHYHIDFIVSVFTIPQPCKLHIKIILVLSQKSHNYRQEAKALKNSQGCHGHGKVMEFLDF